MKWYHFRNGGKVPYIKRQEGGSVPAVKPTVETGIPQGGYARPAWDTYLAGTDPYFIDFSKYAGTKTTPRQYTGVVDGIVPEVPVVTQVPTDTGGSTTVPLTTSVPTYTGDSGFGFGPEGGVQSGTGNAPGTLFNIPVPGQGIDRRAVSNEEHGFTTEDVLDARAKLDSGETLEGFTAPPKFEGGADQATQHANIESAFK